MRPGSMSGRAKPLDRRPAIRPDRFYGAAQQKSLRGHCSQIILQCSNALVKDVRSWPAPRRPMTRRRLPPLRPRAGRRAEGRRRSRARQPPRIGQADRRRQAGRRGGRAAGERRGRSRPPSPLPPRSRRRRLTKAVKPRRQDRRTQIVKTIKPAVAKAEGRRNRGSEDHGSPDQERRRQGQDPVHRRQDAQEHQGDAARVNDFTKGNIEALVESGKIAAKGLESMGQDDAEFARKQFESATAALKTLSTGQVADRLLQAAERLRAHGVRLAGRAASQNTEAAQAGRRRRPADLEPRLGRGREDEDRRVSRAVRT